MTTSIRLQWNGHVVEAGWNQNTGAYMILEIEGRSGEFQKFYGTGTMAGCTRDLIPGSHIRVLAQDMTGWDAPVLSLIQNRKFFDCEGTRI